MTITTVGSNENRLTTTEAANLLGVSRQHVVNLCAKGHLPYEVAGTHRRLRHADVTEFRARTTEMTRDQRRSLWLGVATAAAVLDDPGRARRRALDNLARATNVPGSQHNPWLGQWRDLLDGPVEPIIAALTSPAPSARDLRQNSPFAGLLGENKRRNVLQQFSRADQA